MIVQQIIVTFILTPQVKKHVANEIKDKPVEVVVTKEKVDSLFNSDSESSTSNEAKKELHQDLRKRNQGKQQKRNNKK